VRKYEEEVEEELRVCISQKKNVKCSVVVYSCGRVSGTVGIVSSTRLAHNNPIQTEFFNPLTCGPL
jgi:hypothetical protein